MHATAAGNDTSLEVSSVKNMDSFVWMKLSSYLKRPLNPPDLAGLAGFCKHTVAWSMQRCKRQGSNVLHGSVYVTMHIKMGLARKVANEHTLLPPLLACFLMVLLVPLLGLPPPFEPPNF